MNSVTIVEKEVKTYLQNLICSRCKVPMVIGKYIMMTYPAKYTYTCTKCNYEHIDYDVYPKIVQKEVTDE